MGLSDEQRVEVNDLAELVVRQHMNELFERSIPRIIRASFTAHSNDSKAHANQLAQHICTCPVAKKLDRLMWLLMGIAFGAGVLSGDFLRMLGLL